MVAHPLHWNGMETSNEAQSSSYATHHKAPAKSLWLSLEALSNMTGNEPVGQYPWALKSFLNFRK